MYFNFVVCQKNPSGTQFVNSTYLQHVFFYQVDWGQSLAALSPVKVKHMYGGKQKLTQMKPMDIGSFTWPERHEVR